MTGHSPPYDEFYSLMALTIGKEIYCTTKENAEFVCAMEDVLDVYQRSYDETHPLICMDESSKQHIKETCQPIPAKPGAIEKYDPEYERNGTSNMFGQLISRNGFSFSL
jgi:hypothetical protein